MQEVLNPTSNPVGPVQQKPQGLGILKRLDGKRNFKSNLFLVIGAIVVVLAGIGTGWLLSGKTLANSTNKKVEGVAPGAQKSSTEAGIDDTSAFPYIAQGVLREGGIANEGTHHLERPGGDSQNVYLSSTVIDLQSFVDKKVEIWGQTLSGKKAGWLVDVGKIKVIE